MSVIHPPLAQLTRILARPEGDAERAHVAQCERCQASLHALQEFLALDPAAAANAVELAAVNARLAEMVPQVVGPSAQPASPASSPASSPGKLLQLPAAASSKRTRLPLARRAGCGYLAPDADRKSVV